MNTYADVLDAFPRMLQIFEENKWDVETVRYTLLGSPPIPWSSPLITSSIKSLWQHVSSSFSSKRASSSLLGK